MNPVKIGLLGLGGGLHLVGAALHHLVDDVAHVYRLVVEHGGHVRRQPVLVDADEVDREAEVDRHRVGAHVEVGVAEVPGELVLVAEDVAARAGGLAVRGGLHRVVEHRPPLHHRLRLRIRERERRLLAPGRQIHDRHRVVEAREHVEPVVRLVERHPVGVVVLLRARESEHHHGVVDVREAAVLVPVERQPGDGPGVRVGVVVVRPDVDRRVA